MKKFKFMPGAKKEGVASEEVNDDNDPLPF